ncbi:MAG: PepSY domain-containing protein [Bacillus sp. (in: Bacteria)]|nr:PepSY domain-containing protein [Bacillus sp. (in: firmicutes)]
MKNKVIVGALSAILLLGGAIAVGATNNDTQAEDSIHQEDNKISSNVNGKKVEIETEYGQTGVKAEAGDSNSSTSTTKLITAEKAVEIAVSEVSGTVAEIEQELEHGRLEYKVELDTSIGEAKVRIDAETGKIVKVEHEDDKAEDSTHQTRHSGDDDNKTEDGPLQNRHNGDDDNSKVAK